LREEEEKKKLENERERCESGETDKETRDRKLRIAQETRKSRVGTDRKKTSDIQN
jgi:hypothetical protein